MVMGLKLDFFEVENDVDDILNHMGKSAKLVQDTFDLHRSDCGAFE